jgi:hypothetical protein
MRNAFLSLLLLTLLPGCASSGTGTGKSGLPEPTLVLMQTSSVPPVAREMEGNLPIQFHLRVKNNATQPITLKRVSLQSVGEGAYAVNGSRPFNTPIGPGQSEEVEFWIPATIPYASIAGANGPVTIRTIAQFDSGAGKFQTVATENVSAGTR